MREKWRRGRGHARDRRLGHDDDAPADLHLDLRDLEIAAMGRRIAELERLLAETAVGSIEVDDVEETDSRVTTSTGDDDDEPYTPWGLRIAIRLNGGGR